MCDTPEALVDDECVRLARMAGPAALGLAGVMVGAALTQVFVFGSAALALTPAILIVVFGFVALIRSPSSAR